MTFEQYDDFDKCVKDLINDDFDTNYRVKVKSQAPGGVTLTTTTDYDSKTESFPSKLSVKWAHPSGFTVDKLEVKKGLGTTLETSVADVYPGVDLEFKGSDSGSSKSASLGVTYTHELATITSEFDLMDFSQTGFSVLGGRNGVVAGGSLDVACRGNCGVSDYQFGVGYRPPANNLFAGVRVLNQCSDVKASLHYKLSPKVSVAAALNMKPADLSNHTATGLVKYQCCSSTSMKVKADSCGNVAASVKKSFPEKVSLVAAGELNLHKPDAFKLGLTATLG